MENKAPRKRPNVLNGTTRAMVTGCGKLYVIVNVDEAGAPLEVFTTMGKAGGCAASQAEAIGRLASLALRLGGRPEDVIKQLGGISCHQHAEDVLSCADAVAKALRLAQKGE
jgi:ribonucleoside-diphosphate reductase alpha chain